MKQGYLILETGEIFEGMLIGETKEEVSGEVVFNTSMTGYQEIMTDPSYAGQIIVFTYPLVGNYGVDEAFNESRQVFAKAIIMKEFSSDAKHLPHTPTLYDFIRDYHLPCLVGVDTRQLVKRIREKGTVLGVITDHPTPSVSFCKERNLFDQVTTKEVLSYDNNGPHIVLLDFGFKKSILHYLRENHCKVTVVPYWYPAEQIQALNPDGILVSNGPGDPMNAADQLEKIKELSETYPTMGICLGHQLIALAYGAKTKKLLFGHRGGNHPVKDVQTGKVYLTSQNHGYVVEDGSVDENEFDISFINLNDGTIEGLRHKRKPVMTVQFHPEGNPGPLDTVYIFEEFIRSIRVKENLKTC